jgi:hypothetical protein
LFTVVTAFCFAILGHGQGLLRDFLFKGGISYTEYAFAAVLAVVCPDLGLFDAVDAVISGHVLSLREIGIMTSIGTLYVVGYTVVAYLVFVEKEL